MAWIQDFPGVEAISERAEKAWWAPIGAASPLWAVFGAAASTGVAYWWLTQWSRAAVNFEALAGAATPAPVRIEIVAEPEATPEPATEAGPEPAALTPASEPDIEQPAPLAASATPDVEAFIEEPPAAVAEPAPEPPPADDLTVIAGIGPKLSAALAERGVTRFAQIAAWTAEDVATIDAALSLKGRAGREAWVAQAKRLAKDA